MKNKRNVYLEMKPLAQARAFFLDRFDWSTALTAEEIPVADAVGRILAKPVHARLSAPTYHGSAMDGIAVRAQDTYAASDLAPLELSIGDGAVFVNTGEPLPDGMNAVIMIEHVQVLDDARVRIEAPAFPWQHVRKVGEDIVATEMLFPRHHRIRPYCTGALLAGGVSSVAVLRKPRIMIIPTGGEMVDADTVGEDGLEPGRIIESNSTVIGKLVEAHGGEYVRHEGIRDDADSIASVIGEASATFDAVLVIGGSSAGARDFTRTAIERAGGEVMVHGVTIMPGKPTLLASVGDTPVVGIPGYPVSAIIAFEELVAPALDLMLRGSGRSRDTVIATPTRKIAGKLGMEEFVRVRLGRVGTRMIANPLPRGAGTVTSITRADGIVRVGADLEGYRPDQEVAVELLRPLAEIEGNIVAVGSHDLCLDVIADLLHEQQTGMSLSSSHVGSLAGIMAIKNGRCHLAGSHLLDPEDGSYNTSSIARHIPDVPVRLVHLVERDQGLMVLAGNPLGVQGFEDLTRDEVTFINRQGGSGTRVLLDHELDRRGLSSGDISGYETEEFTHMAVAVAVVSGAADVGLGVLSAARALKLDFIPVTSESYDLIIPEAFFETPPLQRLLEVTRSAEFARRVNELGGYDTTRTGQVACPE
jgi:molybdopterin molybdotransferase/putative molybdopterin biosynthesis protein